MAGCDCGSSADCNVFHHAGCGAESDAPDLRPQRTTHGTGLRASLAERVPARRIIDPTTLRALLRRAAQVVPAVHAQPRRAAPQLPTCAELPRPRLGARAE